MAFYIPNYYASGVPLLPEQVDANRQAWRDWDGQLEETCGTRTSKGLVVNSVGLTEYQGDFKGASVIEAESLERAAEIAKLSPAVAYGGRVEVLQEFSLDPTVEGPPSETGESDCPHSADRLSAWTHRR